MDRLSARRPGGGQDLVRRQIALTGRRRAQQHRLVGFAHMRRVGVGLGIDGHGAHTQAPGRADDTAGDLAAVGDQKGGDHWPTS